MTTFVNCLIKAIDRGTFSSDPFPHINITFNWNEPNLCEYFPKLEDYQSLNQSKSLGRRFIELGTLASLDPELHKFWSNELNNDETKILVEKLFYKLNAGYLPEYSTLRKYIFIFLNKLIKQDYVDHLSKSYSNIYSKIILKTLSFIGYFDDGSYVGKKRISIRSIKPHWTFASDANCYETLKIHTDKSLKVLTLLIPLNINKDHRRGTSLYAPKYNLRHWDSGRYDENLFQKKFESIHLFGNGIAFGKTDKTWHGVEQGSNSEPRLTLILNCER